jgi:hypothetical protein
VVVTAVYDVQGVSKKTEQKECCDVVRSLTHRVKVGEAQHTGGTVCGMHTCAQ